MSKYLEIRFKQSYQTYANIHNHKLNDAPSRQETSYSIAPLLGGLRQSRKTFYFLFDNYRKSAQHLVSWRSSTDAQDNQLSTINCTHTQQNRNLMKHHKTGFRSCRSNLYRPMNKTPKMVLVTQRVICVKTLQHEHYIMWRPTKGHGR